MKSVTMLRVTRLLERGWAWWWNPRSHRHVLHSPKGKLWDYQLRNGKWYITPEKYRHEIR